MPGPWHVSADGHAGGNVFRFNVSGPHFTPEEKAQAVNDARLIAKALGATVSIEFGLYLVVLAGVALPIAAFLIKDKEVESQ